MNRRKKCGSQGNLAVHIKGEGALGCGVFKGCLGHNIGAGGTAHPVVCDIVNTDVALPSCGLVTVWDD